MQVQDYKNKRLVDILKEWDDIELAKDFVMAPFYYDVLTEEAYIDENLIDETLLCWRNSLWRDYEAVRIPFLEANPSADWDKEIEECEQWINDFYVERGI